MGELQEVCSLEKVLDSKLTLVDRLFASEFFGHNFRLPEPTRAGDPGLCFQLENFKADRNAYFSQHLKNLELPKLVSTMKFLHGRVLWNF